MFLTSAGFSNLSDLVVMSIPCELTWKGRPSGAEALPADGAHLQEPPVPDKC